MALDQELRGLAEVAVTHCRDGEELAGIVPAEPAAGVRVYLCAYRDGEETSWLVLSADASPIEDRSLVRDTVSIAALYELAGEVAGEDDGEARVATGTARLAGCGRGGPGRLRRGDEAGDRHRRRAPPRRRARLQGSPQLVWPDGRKRLRISARGRPRGPDAQPARVRRAAGGVGAGSSARAVRDADAQHRGGAHRRGTAAGERHRRRRRADDRSP